MNSTVHVFENCVQDVLKKAEHYFMNLKLQDCFESANVVTDNREMTGRSM